MNINKIISNLINNKASREEHEILEQWKNDSEENLKELNDIIKLQKATTGFEDYKNYDVENALAKVETNILHSDLHPELKKDLNIKRYVIIMISIAVAVSIIFLVNNYNSRAVEPKTFNTEFASMQLNLKDGSVVELDQYSYLELGDDFINNRVVELKGRAFFTVNDISDELPFTINIPNAKVRVIGTDFSVSSENGIAEVAVISGIVEFSSENRKVNLHKGERLLFKDNVVAVFPNSDNNYYSWKTGILEYDDAPLKDVIEDLMWTFKANIDTSEIVFPTGCRIKTKYQNMELDDILNELKSLFGIEFSRKDGVIFVKDINCS